MAISLSFFSNSQTKNPASAMKEIKTEIIINAPKEKVWEVLTDFEAYGEWNPFIVSIEGKGEVGKKLKNTMVNGDKTNVFKPEIKKFEVNQHFEWLGSIPLGLFTGRHYFILEDLGNNQTKLIHGEKFGGLLRGMIMKQIGESTQQSFINMNRALKERTEK
jgi:hypothetical protein